MTTAVDYVGQKFGNLTVTGRGGKKNRRTFFECVCDCGKTCTVRSDHVRSGHTVSCGCKNQRKEKRGHNGFREKSHPLRQIWNAMKSRCYRPDSISYRFYGAKGVRICDRWLVFENFDADMSPRPVGCSIDRIDSNGDYCPENCKWSTALEQSRNRSSTRNITLYGRSWPVSQWAEISGIQAKTIYARLDRGWSDKRAVFTPVR